MTPATNPETPDHTEERSEPPEPAAVPAVVRGSIPLQEIRDTPVPAAETLLSDPPPAPASSSPHTQTPTHTASSDSAAPAPPERKPIFASDPTPAPFSNTAARTVAADSTPAQPARSDAPASNTPEPKPSAPAAQAPPELPIRPAAAPRDLRVAVGSGEQRVELRVTDRSGEIHVDVRTPDQRLAGALRDDLPALSSRLEAAGLRAHVWRPASTGGPERFRVETTARAASQNFQEQQGQQGRRKQDEPPPQRPRKPETNASQAKPDRKDFQWLFNSLR